MQQVSGCVSVTVYFYFLLTTRRSRLLRLTGRGRQKDRGENWQSRRTLTSRRSPFPLPDSCRGRRGRRGSREQGEAKVETHSKGNTYCVILSTSVFYCVLYHVNFFVPRSCTLNVIVLKVKWQVTWHYITSRYIKHRVTWLYVTEHNVT